MFALEARGERLRGAWRARSWIALAAVGSVLALASLLLLPTLFSFATVWSDTAAKTYTHGPLIAAICVWLLVRRRDELAAVDLAPSYRAVLIVAMLSCAWVIAYRSGLQLLHQVVFPLALAACVWAAFGRYAARQAVLPIAYLFFALPFWSVVNGVLQSMTVTANRVLLRISGVPAHVEGNLVHIPSGTFEIAGGCSGLHLFIVAAAIAALYGELNRDTLWVRIKLLVLAVAIAIVANWIRVFTIIVAGHLTDMQHYLVTVDHYYYGWVLFGIGMALFLFIAKRIPAPDDTRPAPAVAPRVAGKAVATGALAALGALAIGPVLLVFASQSVAEAKAAPRLPGSVGEWSAGVEPAFDRWQPQYPAADNVERADYSRGPVQVAAFSASYFSQSQGKELIGYDNSLLDPTDARVARRRLPHAGFEVNELEFLAADGRRGLIWYFYEVGERRLVSDVAAQLYYGSASLLRPLVSEVVALRTECDPDCDRARQTLGSIAAHFARPRE
jgi:exosortase A